MVCYWHIYESRPNVTSDAAALAIKSGKWSFVPERLPSFCSSDVTAPQGWIEEADLNRIPSN